MVRALKLLPVAALIVLTACGNSADDTTGATAPDPAAAAPVQPTPTEPPLPRCATVWVEGDTLPLEYLGCRADGVRVIKSLRCETGQELFTYSGRFFAIPGGRIFAADAALADDAQFQRMHRSCTA